MKTTFTESSRPKRNDDYIWKEVEGEAYILGEQGLALRFFNPAATLIWSSCDGKKTVREIARAVCAQFEVDEEQALGDVTEFLEKLAELGMVTVPEAPG